MTDLHVMTRKPGKTQRRMACRRLIIVEDRLHNAVGKPKSSDLATLSALAAIAGLRLLKLIQDADCPIYGYALDYNEKCFVEHCASLPGSNNALVQAMSLLEHLDAETKFGFPTVDEVALIAIGFSQFHIERLKK